MLIEGPPTAYEREDDLFELVASGKPQEAIGLGRILRVWWLNDERWFADYAAAAQRVSWLNGFTHALHAIDQSKNRQRIREIDARIEEIDSLSKRKPKRKTSGGSGKSNQP